MVEGEDAGLVYNTRQAAEALGVGSAMMRRYAQTLEEITGEEVPQTRRDGRQFSRAHLDTLLRAKAFVDSHNGLSVEAALRMATSTTGDTEGLPIGVPMGSIADSAALIAALQEAITRPLVAELRELRADQDDMQALRAEVAALRSELAETRPLPLNATPERIDRALEVEMLESPGSVEKRQAVSKVVDCVEPQRREQESWVATVALEALAAGSELPAAARVERKDGGSTGEALGEAQGSPDGPMVRAARWLERWLYRKG